MPSPFTAENWDLMDNSTRIVFCHLMAKTAIKLAKTSPFSVSEAFLRLAESWSRLARELEASKRFLDALGEEFPVEKPSPPYDEVA